MEDTFDDEGGGVSAVRWRGDNPREVLDLVGRAAGGRARFETDAADPGMGWVWIERTHSWAACPVGHWVVVDAAGVAAPCPPDVFDASYRGGGGGDVSDG